MKAKTGPKEASMRKQREAAADPNDIVRQLQQKRAEAFAEFEAKQDAMMEKELAAVIDPLRAERSKLATRVNDDNTRIAEIDRTIAKLLGKDHKVIRSGGKGSGGKRFRPSADEISAKATALGKYWLDKFGSKNEISRKDIIDLAIVGEQWKNHIPKIIEAWNAGNKEHAIGTNGKPKVLSRYIMH